MDGVFWGFGVYVPAISGIDYVLFGAVWITVGDDTLTRSDSLA